MNPIKYTLRRLFSVWSFSPYFHISMVFKNNGENNCIDKSCSEKDHSRDNEKQMVCVPLKQNACLIGLFLIRQKAKQIWMEKRKAADRTKMRKNKGKKYN